MHFFSSIASIALFLLPVSTAQLQVIEGPTDCLTAGDYVLCQSVYSPFAQDERQAIELIKLDAQGVRWEAAWNYINPEPTLRGFPNVESQLAKGIQLRNIISTPTSWSWTWYFRGVSKVNVEYVIWTGVSSNGTPASKDSSYEIKISLSGKTAVQPAGSVVASDISLVGQKWDLWRGAGADWQTLTFQTKGDEIKDFAGDLNEFFKYIATTQGVPTTQYVHAIRAGAEPFSGASALVIWNYNVTINN